ncbi:MAG: hypothetical protein PUF79_03705 [Lactobacillaceae bacterium]|nr:hypothetical protein [Lactobacillaceae bacterium]
MRRWMILTIMAMIVLFGSGVVQASSQKTVNTQLSQELVDHQAYADNDPANYGYAKYIRRISDKGNGRIAVQVTRNFCRLSDNDKTNVMNQVQVLARMVLVENHRINKHQAARGLDATIRYQKQVVGQSRPDDHYHYRW